MRAELEAAFSALDLVMGYLQLKLLASAALSVETLSRVLVVVATNVSTLAELVAPRLLGTWRVQHWSFIHLSKAW